MGGDDFPLPVLLPTLKLYPASPGNGEPMWSLHNPVANTYFKIGWAEFECLARFSSAGTALNLKKRVEAETPIRIGLDDIKDLIVFLHSNGLLAPGPRPIPFADKAQPLWKKILHSYLYFTVPLFRPEKFLRATLPWVSPLLSRGFITAMLFLLGLGALLTLSRADEFFHSFTGFFSLAGILQGLAVLAVVKIVHEFAHAYTAVKYGVPVPHMGVAVMVLYPVLYTETTAGWRLPSRRARFHIGMAGIIAELCLASVFLIVWNIMPAGSTGQSLAFTVVSVSLIGSLLVNLNPLMRFDGYYMMSDLTGIENLQHRACDFARWALRRVLFGLKDDPPEALPAGKQKFLTFFGLALLVYRFFLFAGISVLVYHLFFKPLGLILMMVEIVWFILLPILSELRVWWRRRSEIWDHRRGRAVLLLSGFVLLAGTVPWQTQVEFPAVLHARNYASLYPYAPSLIEDLSVAEGQDVRAGQVLARLSSRDLDKQLAQARTHLEQLRLLQRRVRTDPALLQDKYATLDLDIETAGERLRTLQDQQKNLTITAAFDGVIRDLDPSIQAGRYIRQSDLLFRVVSQSAPTMTGYGGEDDVERLVAGGRGVFIPDAQPFTSYPVRIETISATDTDALKWPELASIFRGPVPAELDRASGQIVPLKTIYQVGMRPDGDVRDLPGIVLAGTVRADGRPLSPVYLLFSRLAGLVVRETGLN